MNGVVSIQRSLRREEGSALILVLLISGALLIVGLALSFSVMVEHRISLFDRNHQAAIYVAEIGLKQAEVALTGSYQYNGWNDDLDTQGAFTRPAHAGDQPPLNLVDRSLNRKGLVVYRWGPPSPGTVTGALWQVPVNVQDGNARYSVWVRNNSDDFGTTTFADADDVVEIVSLGELLDPGGGVKARTYLAEILTLQGAAARNYAQKGLGAGGASTIEE